MLTRLKFRKDYRVVRCFSDKSKGEDKPPETTRSEEQETNNSEKLSNTEKIQAILKTMMKESRQTDNEYNFARASGVYRKHKKELEKVEVKTERIEDSITAAAGEVAQAIGGDVKHTEAELLSKVLGKVNPTPTNLSDLILGMKIDRTKESEDDLKLETRGQQVKRFVQKAKMDPLQRTRYSARREKDGMFQQNKRVQESITQTTPIDIFSGENLGIFKKKDVPNYGTKLDTWDYLQQRELSLSISQPPANYFQKMIQWTNQGKVWKFPINNEQGLEDEEKVHFSEHVFLDLYLEDWCPKKGPIRHFMELVCVGLSKNPFYTAKEKKEHIMWYKDYFESKKTLLTEVGAWDLPKSTNLDATP